MGNSNSTDAKLKSQQVVKDVIESIQAKGQVSVKSKLENSVTDPKERKQLVSFFSDHQQLNDYYFPLEDFLYDEDKNKKDGPVEVKIKLVIIDLEKWHEHLALAWCIGNISNIFGFTKYGLTHAGIQMGSYIIHWFNDSLVHFTPIKGTNPLLAMDIGKINMKSMLDVAKVSSLCKLIVEYNTNKKYDNKTANCHHFVNDSLNKLGFEADKIEFPGQLGKYLNELRTKGVNDKKFISPLDKKVTFFKSHKIFDQYCHDLFTEYNKKKGKKTKSHSPIYEHFQNDLPGDYALLKAFDRAFWIAKFKQEHIDANGGEKDEILYEKNKEGKCCPWGNPYDKSFW